MRLNNNELQWVYDNIDKLKQAVVALDFCKKWRVGYGDETKKRAYEQMHDLAFSFLMVAMGEQIPKTLWSVSDYSKMYGLIMDANDCGELEITNDG